MKKERNYQPVMAALVVLIVGIFLWILYGEWQDRRKTDAQGQESQHWKLRAEDLAKRVSRLEDELKGARGEAVDSDRLAQVFEARPGEEASAEAPAGAVGVEAQVLSFFKYLDSRDYVRAHRLEGGSYRQYVLAVEELAANPPKVAGETESLFAMLKNVSHFFRVLGKNRVQLFAEVLRQDGDIMEQAMGLFFEWYTGPYDKLRGKPSLATLYQYASFLTETLGGRSYVMRRDSKIRLLTTYYCVRILDLANDRKMNPNGVDIRPLIASTAQELQSRTGLAQQRSYLAELERLARKYEVPINR
jgi:hypothetical protein